LRKESSNTVEQELKENMQASPLRPLFGLGCFVQLINARMPQLNNFMPIHTSSAIKLALPRLDLKAH
jgi:hypothetical protein